MTWYDGGKSLRVRRSRAEPPVPTTASISWATGDDALRRLVRPPRLVPESRCRSSKAAQDHPRSIGHHAEWIKACKQGKPEDAKAGFAYSGPFTEALLVGSLAARLQKRIEWDSANMRATQFAGGRRHNSQTVSRRIRHLILFGL